MPSIIQASSGSALNHVRGLMRSFVVWHRENHREDLALIDRYFDEDEFERELAELPGPYAPPPAPARAPLQWIAVDGFARPLGAYEAEAEPLPEPAGGCLLIAYSAGMPAGCVALRNLGEGVCEMKRMFVPMTFRGLGVGRALADRVMAEGRRLGYRRMRLDTSRRQHEAISLYEKSGFTRIAPYYELTEDLRSWLVFYERRL